MNDNRSIRLHFHFTFTRVFTAYLLWRIVEIGVRSKGDVFQGRIFSRPGTVVIFEGSNSIELEDHRDVDEVSGLLTFAEREEALVLLLLLFP